MTPCRSDFLFSTPTFWGGVGSSVGLAGNYYSFNGSRSSVEADYRALFSDFAVTGRDLLEAVQAAKTDRELNEKNCVEEDATHV